MHRHCTTTLLIIAYLASQLALAVPHAHGASGQSQPSDHNARPHLHVSWFAHGGHAHHHEGNHTHSEPHSTDSTAGDEDHDSDAIYLTNEIGTRSGGTNVLSLDSLQFAGMLVVAAIPAATVNPSCSADAYYPDKCSSGCPLYLALRALRI